MTLKLKDSRVVADIAELMYDFLPGSGNQRWKGHVSFKTIAEKVGVGAFWQAGSKTPMIVALLERTLEHRRDRFEPLIVEVVRAAIPYRQKQGNPITPAIIDKLNGLILEVGFKFPALWDPDFRKALASDSSDRARERVDEVLAEERIKESEREARTLQLEDLKRRYFALDQESDRQSAGRALESVLNNLFNLNGLSPREPFRVVGEQIDGSFELDHEVYLIEAKWEKKACPEADLLVFREKVEGKSKYTRGVFISINGVTLEAKDAITRGKQPVFFIVDGYDVLMLLEDRIDLNTFLRQRRRILGEEGAVSVPFPELFAGGRGSYQ
jgi:hypothetical protein